MNGKNVFGFIKSEIDGSEKIFGIGNDENIPDKYTYRPYLPKVINQGSLSICVPCSISAFLNWKENLEEGSNKDNKIALMEIYNSKDNAGEGMTFKAAFKFLRHNGVNSDNGNLKINEYGLVLSIESLKYAIIANGPCVGALPVYSSDDDFWNKKMGDKLLGYHAISIVGYNEDGFVIRNSWGDDFGEDGYTCLEYEDYNKLIEVWTVIS